MSKMQSPLINISYLKKGHEVHLDDLEKNLATDKSTGLSSEEAKKRLENFGKNEIITPEPSLWKLYLAPLLDFLITLYLVMTFILIILSIWVDGIYSKISFWLVMIVFNMGLAIFQQFRAQKKLNALQSLSPPKAKVIRNNKVEEIFARDLVPGDLIKLDTGDKIPADSRLVEANNMTVNEASLTGESVPVEKHTNGGDPIDPNAPISEHHNFVYLGTFIQTGTGKAMVVRTGNDTELGQLASAMGEMHSTALDIPLRRKVNSMGRRLAIIMIIFLISKVVHSIYIQWDDGITPFQFATDLSDGIITAMSVVPINIPLLVTAILLTGVLAMAQNRVVVKNLAIIETLGRCSVLCSDKTGTMTTSNMTVKLLWDTVNFYGVELDEYYDNKISFIPESEVHRFLDKDELLYPPFDHIKPGSPLELVMTSAVLNNDAKLIQRESSDGTMRFEAIGNHTDGALLALALAQGFNENEIKSRYTIENEYPFESALKRMTGLFKDNKENDYMVLSKGATEVILPRCKRIGDEDNTRELTEKEAEQILSKVNNFANNGYRVISLAYRSLDDIPNLDSMSHKEERKFLETDLTYIGFAVIFDPPRPGVRNAVAQLDSASVFPIMITGDSASTAETIGRQVGILDPDELVVEGHQAAELEDEEFFKVSVFARVSPKDKEIIVRRYQDRGDVVAMTGDGVNDSLAISRSDAGVAMGITGTEVTKEAADIIITDDSYISLVKGIEEGRNLYERIRMMIFFYLFINFAEAVLYFTSSFISGFYLITQWQRIYIFTIIHALPVLALIFGPPDKNIMKLKPRNNDALVTKQLVFAGAVFAFSYLFSMVSVYFLTYSGYIPTNEINASGLWTMINSLQPSDLSHPVSFNQAKARTMLISVMYLTESFIVLSIRRFNQGVIEATKEDANILVWVLVLVSPIFHIAMMYYQPLQEYVLGLGFETDLLILSPIDWVIVIMFALIPLFMIEWFKKSRREKNIQF